VKGGVVMSEETSKTRSLFLRYFLHGLAFSLLMLVLSFVLAFVFVLLVALGSIIGLIIGFLILLMVYAAINVFLMDKIWNRLIKNKWTNLLFHGLALLIVLGLASILVFIVNVLAPNIFVSIVMFFVYCPIDGYLAKIVAEGWIDEDAEAAREDFDKWMKTEHEDPELIKLADKLFP
jgi:hypothetical protein